MKILEVTRVTPSPNSAGEFFLPLTFHDLYWFKLFPDERLFFYQLNDLTPARFNSEIVPKLKQSLSLTLLHYLPLTGNLKWPSDSPKPIISYTPPNDGVSLTVAESNADFDLLSSNGIYEAAELRPLTPKLTCCDESASPIALQITLFSNKGFCIGITAHHAVLDGQTTTLFFKSWAYICKQGNNPLPPELTPFFDRSVIRDPNGVDMIYLNQWLALLGHTNINKSVEGLPDRAEAPDLVRATFEISEEDIKKLRERVLLSHFSSDGAIAKQLHLSSFVLTLAYLTTCMVKARGGDGDVDRVVAVGFTVDCRPRLKPPVPENYFGNCNTGATIMMKARDLFGENGFVYAVEKISDKVKESVEKGVLHGIENKLAVMFEVGRN